MLGKCSPTNPFALVIKALCQASRLLGRYTTTLSHVSSPFALVILGIESLIFALD
jgi:hypothetical protein